MNIAETTEGQWRGVAAVRPTRRDGYGVADPDVGARRGRWLDLAAFAEFNAGVERAKKSYYGAADRVAMAKVRRRCLWLRGLPPLVVSEDGQAATMALPVAERSPVHYASPGPDRGKRRSVTPTGLAAAMALQWGGDVREDAA